MCASYVKKAFYFNENIKFFSCVPLTATPENSTLITTAKDIYLKFDKSFDALRCAIMLNSMDLIRRIFLDCSDKYYNTYKKLLLI